MIKKLFLFSAIASITACQAYSETSQCDPEKNYIKSNPETIENYKKLKLEGKIKSFYYESDSNTKCNDNFCANFDEKKYGFVEMNFDNPIRKGIYTITKNKNIDINSSECLPINPATSNNKENYCLIAEKNKDNVIKSQYKLSLNSDNKTTILKFEDLKNKIVLSEFVYQVYSTGAIGGPGGGICTPKRLNNPEYKFDPYDLP